MLELSSVAFSKAKCLTTSAATCCQPWLPTYYCPGVGYIVRLGSDLKQIYQHSGCVHSYIHKYYMPINDFLGDPRIRIARMYARPRLQYVICYWAERSAIE